MWNIHDWMKDKGYLINSFISSDIANIEDARILTENSSDISIVYVGYNPNSERNIDSVFLVNGQDIIYIDSADHETVFNEINKMFQCYSKWELAINKNIFFSDGLQRILELSYPVLSIPIFIYDGYGKVLAISQEYPEDTHYHWKELLTLRYIPENRMEELKNSGSLSKVFDNKGPTYFDTSPFGVSYLYSPIIINGEIMAHLVFFGAIKEIPKGAIYLMSAMTESMNNFFKFHYNDYVYNYQISNLILNLLDKNEVSENTLINELKKISWKLDDNYIILTFMEPVEGKPVMRDRIGNKLQSNFKHSQKVIFGEYLVLLINTSKYGSEIKDLFNNTKEILGAHLKCGCSYQFNDFKKLAFYYSQALLTMNMAGTTGEIFNIDDYILPIINNLLSENILFNTLVHPDLLVLKDYDRKNNTDLCNTLKVYLTSAGNYNIISKELHIHRNTAIYRLQRIRDIIDCDLNDPKTKEHLFISFYFIKK